MEGFWKMVNLTVQGTERVTLTSTEKPSRLTLTLQRNGRMSADAYALYHILITCPDLSCPAQVLRTVRFTHIYLTSHLRMHFASPTVSAQHRTCLASILSLPAQRSPITYMR